MKEVCLVYMATGDYDTYTNDAILAFETLKEGEEAIKMMEAELAAVWMIDEPSYAFEKLPVSQRGDGAYHRLQNEYAAQVRDLIKVFPAEFSEHKGISYVGNIPDEREKQRGDLAFSAVMMPVNNLVDLLSSSAKQDG